MNTDMQEKQSGNRILQTIWNLTKFIGGIVGVWIAYSKFVIDHEVAIHPAIDAERFELVGQKSTFLSYYADTNGSGKPLVLLHSINAAGSAYEMKPFFDHYRIHRPTYALDLPGFGFSERSNRVYTTELYVQAIHDFLVKIDEPCDVIALSLSSEFAAIAAYRYPDLFNSLTLISPTGFSKKEVVDDQSMDQQQTQRNLYHFLANQIWAQALFDLLATQISIQYFLQQSFYGQVDRGLEYYSWLSSHQPGARYAPLYFISGQLFSRDIFHTIYHKLTIPALVMFDDDPNTSFERLPRILDERSNWRARRIMNTRGLPHFERMPVVAEALDEFWQSLSLSIPDTTYKHK